MAGFEAIGVRVAEAVFRRLANASVVSEETVNHGDYAFRAIFEEPDAMLDVVATNSKVLRYPIAYPMVLGEHIEINGLGYAIASTPLRDASGQEFSAQVVPL